jgi:hypothetical protein
MEQTNLSEARRRAERRVEELRGFYGHVLTYVLVNALLFVINYFASPRVWWFQWPLFGWGIGLLCHGLSLCRCGLWSDAWKERKIAELMEKEQRAR